MTATEYVARLLAVGVDHPDFYSMAPTDEHISLAEEEISFFRSSLMMFILCNTAKPFHVVISEQFDLPTFNPRVLMYFTSSLNSMKTKVAQNELVSGISERPLGKIGEKVTCIVKIMRSSYSQNWNKYVASGITENGCLVWFFVKTEQDVDSTITVSGTIKRIGIDEYLDARPVSTQLTRVKVLDSAVEVE